MNVILRLGVTLETHRVHLPLEPVLRHLHWDGELEKVRHRFLKVAVILAASGLNLDIRRVPPGLVVTVKEVGVETAGGFDLFHHCSPDQPRVRVQGPNYRG